MIRKIFSINMLFGFLFLPPAIFAQLKNEPVKDTAIWLSNHLHMTIGKKVFYENGKVHHINQYMATTISVKDCKIDATVKLSQMRMKKGVGDITYTLTYSIPLGEIDHIVTENRRDTTAKYDGAPLFFTGKNNKQVIYYKMIEDHTGRVEAEGYYSEATLWRRGIERPQIVEVLNALRLRCSGE